MEGKYELYRETEELLIAVNKLDLPKLRTMVDDDFGIVDVDPEGKPIIINDMEEWEAYMEKNIIVMRELKAELSYEIDEYNERVAQEMAFVVVRFKQRVRVPESSEMQHNCIATIVWKKSTDGWKEARWHCSRLPS